MSPTVGGRMASSSLPPPATMLFICLLPLIIAALLSSSVSATADPPAFPWLDPSLPISVRVSSLIGNLTLDEKIALLQNTNPPLPRLGLPGYDWWSEASHGQHSEHRWNGHSSLPWPQPADCSSLLSSARQASRGAAWLRSSRLRSLSARRGMPVSCTRWVASSPTRLVASTTTTAPRTRATHRSQRGSTGSLHARSPLHPAPALTARVLLLSQVLWSECVRSQHQPHDPRAVGTVSIAALRTQPRQLETAQSTRCPAHSHRCCALPVSAVARRRMARIRS